MKEKSEEDKQKLKWKKIGNRYYALDEDGDIHKSTYKEDDKVYCGCGSWTLEELQDEKTHLDGNTVDEFDKIIEFVTKKGE